MYSALCFCLRDALYAMYARFILEYAVNSFACYGKDDFLESSGRAFRIAGYFHFPSFVFAVFDVHAVEVSGKDSGITVQCQDEKSQLKNKAKALTELRTRIYNMEYEKYLNEIASKRKTMVSSGDRSAKIRTYNYPQGRITDHRINYTLYNLSAFMDGDILDCMNHLIVAENTERLKESEL